MITKDMIMKGIDEGIVHFVPDPVMERGTVCQIGDEWFYFGGEIAEYLSPEVFLAATDKRELVRMVFEVLDDFRKSGEEFADDYRYYDMYMKEHIGPRKLRMQLGVVLELTAEEETAIFAGTEYAVKQAVKHIVEAGRIRAEGYSRIPQESIQEFNDSYDTEYEECEFDFDIERETE